MFGGGVRGSLVWHQTVIHYSVDGNCYCSEVIVPVSSVGETQRPDESKFV